MKLPRFNLRDLFWLVLVSALDCASWLQYRQVGSLQDQCRALRQEYRLIYDRLNECNDYLNQRDPNRDDHDQF